MMKARHALLGLLATTPTLAACDRAADDWNTCQNYAEAGKVDAAIAACARAVETDRVGSSGKRAVRQLERFKNQREQQEMRQRDEDAAREAAAEAKRTDELIAEAKGKIELQPLPSDYGWCGATNMNGVGFSSVWRCRRIVGDSYMTGPICEALAKKRGLVVTERARRVPENAGYFCLPGSHAE